MPYGPMGLKSMLQQLMLLPRLDLMHASQPDLCFGFARLPRRRFRGRRSWTVAGNCAAGGDGLPAGLEPGRISGTRTLRADKQAAGRLSKIGEDYAVTSSSLVETTRYRSESVSKQASSGIMVRPARMRPWPGSARFRNPC